MTMEVLLPWQQATYATLVLLLTLSCVPVMGDINSGCPLWGCLPWGSFSLSSGIPSVNSTVAWKVNTDIVPINKEDIRVPRACVSGQHTVICTTHSGYVAIDPTNGKQLWSYSTMSKPYLPIMDIFGDIIGMDSDAMYYVGADGTPKKPISLGILKPEYSIMISSNSIMLLTASTIKTNQIFTFGLDGLIEGAIPLKVTIAGWNGTFIPTSQPIIAGNRAYVMTHFVPHDSESKVAKSVSMMMRLYVFDLAEKAVPRITIPWYFDFGNWSLNDINPREDIRRAEGMDPIVTYFNETIYVNLPSYSDKSSHNSEKSKQPYPSQLWAIKDMGSSGDLVFKVDSLYGPMAVFDTYDKPLKSAEKSHRKKLMKNDEDHLIWVMNRSPAMFVGINSRNGTAKNIQGFSEIFETLGGWITSSLSITRSVSDPGNDQLVFGTSDSSGQAKLSIVEIEGNKAKLVYSKSVSLPKNGNKARIEGQIVNFAFKPSFEKFGGIKSKDTWTLGLAAVVAEYNSTNICSSVVGLF